MNKLRLIYFEKEDVLHLVAADGPESNSIELSPNITAELNELGELIGLEILNASTFIRDSILESVQGKLMQLKCGATRLTSRAGLCGDSWHGGWMRPRRLNPQ